MTSRPDLTIVVLTYNRWDLVRTCLDTLLSDWRDEWELLLVDNGSATPMPDVLCSRPERVRIVRLDTNQTFSEANNAGGRAARGRYVLFLNNDVIASANQIAPMLAALRDDDSAGVAGPRLVYPGGMRTQHAGIRPMLWGLPSNYAVGANPDDPRINVGGPVFAVTGAALCIDRALFERLGGFDTRFRFGYEDVDLCLRAAAADRSVLFVPEAVGVHAESETLGSAHYNATRAANYAHYRERWDSLLLPLERRYLVGLHRAGVRGVVIVGTGAAGRALAQVLSSNGIRVVGFTTSNGATGDCEGIAVRPLDALPRGEFDRLIVGTQYYFEIEGQLRPYDPQREPLFPVLD